MYKPSELFLGVVEIFAILILGGIIAFFIHYYYSADINRFISLTETQTWIALFCISYFIGNIVSFTGEQIDKNSPVNKFINRKFQPIWESVEAIKNEIHPVPEQTVINIYLWCRSVLISVSPEAMADVNKITAAADFFRNLYVLLPIIGIMSLFNQQLIFGTVMIMLCIPCIYISAFTRLNLLKRIAQHVIVLYRLGKIVKPKESDSPDISSMRLPKKKLKRYS